MRCLLAPAGGLLLVDAGMLLRRRSCSGPLLLLLGVSVCLFYQTLLARNRLRSGQQQPAADSRSRKAPEEVLMEETRRFISALERLRRDAPTQVWSQRPPRQRRAVVLMGRHLVSDPEVHLYQQVLQEMDYEVQLSRYAETSNFLRKKHDQHLTSCWDSVQFSVLSLTRPESSPEPKKTRIKSRIKS